jgi:hypothetical protein
MDRRLPLGREKRRNHSHAEQRTKQRLSGDSEAFTKCHCFGERGQIYGVLAFAASVCCSNMGRILDVGNNQKPLRGGGVWVIAREHLQRSDRLNNACAIGICLQDCKWLKFAEWRLIGFRQIHLVWRLGAPPKTSVSCCIALLPHSARAGPVRRSAVRPGRPNSAR